MSDVKKDYPFERLSEMFEAWSESIGAGSEDFEKSEDEFGHGFYVDPTTSGTFFAWASVWIDQQEIIQSLKQQLAEQEWVSVEDRLPENSKMVLAYYNDGKTAFIDWVQLVSHLGDVMPNITHWKPITPPKE